MGFGPSREEQTKKVKEYAKKGLRYTQEGVQKTAKVASDPRTWGTVRDVAQSAERITATVRGQQPSYGDQPQSYGYPPQYGYQPQSYGYPPQYGYQPQSYGYPPAVPPSFQGGAHDDLYEAAAEHFGEQFHGGYGGGSKVFYGAQELDMEAIKEYESTLNSFTKISLVKSIVEVMRKMGVDVSGANFEEQVKSIAKKIPNAKLDSGNFKSEAEKHKALCKKIAETINEQMGTTVIDPTAKPEAVCQMVAEIIESLKAGMRVEFLVVNKEIKNVLSNLLVLQSKLGDYYEQLREAVMKVSDVENKRKLVAKKDLVEKMLQEMKRQVTMLKNLVNVTLSPAETKLSSLIGNDASIETVIERIQEMSPGSSQFGQVISDILTGLGVTADYALIVDNALKKVGMSINEYASERGPQKLDQLVAEKMAQGDLGDVDELKEFLDAYKLLSKNFYRSQDIKDTLERTRKGGAYTMEEEYGFEEVDGGYHKGVPHSKEEDNIKSMQSKSMQSIGGFGFDRQISGGVDADEYLGGMYRPYDSNQIPVSDENQFKRSKLDKRIRVKKEVRDIVFKTFSRLLDERSKVLIESLNKLADNIGTKIPLSDQLDGLRNSLVKLRPIFTKKYGYLILVGYFNDSLTRERRDTFLSQMRLIRSYVESMLNMRMYSQASDLLRDILGAIDAMIKLVDTYSDKVAQKFGSAERNIRALGGEEAEEMLEEETVVSEVPETEEDEEKKKKKKQEEEEAEAKEGGADEEVCKFLDKKEGGADDYPDYQKFPEEGVMRKIPLQLGKVIKKFDYYYQVAHIRHNLKSFATEVDHYGENYKDLKAEAIARKIDNIRVRRNEMLEHLRSETTFIPGSHFYSSGQSLSTFLGSDYAKRNKIKESTDVFIRKYHDVLSNFWETVEAVDEYMKLLTSDLIKNYEQYEDIKSMIEDTDVIYDWYSDEVGDLIEQLFDQFPSFIAGFGCGNEVGGNLVLATDGTNVDNIRKMPRESIYSRGEEDHLYANVAKQMKAKGIILDKLPGDPFLTTYANDTDVGFSGVKLIRKINQNVVVLKNILSIFSKFGNREIYKKAFMTPTQIYKNLQEFLEYASFGIGLPEQVYLIADIKGKRSYDYKRSKQIRPPDVGIPTPPDLIADHLNVLVDQYINLWGRVASLNIEANLPYDPRDERLKNHVSDFATASDSDMKKDLLSSLIGSKATTRTPANDGVNQAILFRQSYGIYMRGTIGGGMAQGGDKYTEDFRGGLEDEDETFALMIKSMCAKILVILGMQDILERPDERITYNPIRFIVGAGEETPKINEGAVELYVRLPLLLEFYRDLFDFYSLRPDGNPEFIPLESSRPTRAEKISLVPEFEGIFSPLINIVFKKNKNYTLTNYTEDELKEVIAEINHIWDKLSPAGGENASRYIIDELVKEINRRYGLVSRKERNLYEIQQNERYLYGDVADPLYGEYGSLKERKDIDIPLLPGEEYVEAEQQVDAPSRHYVTQGRAGESDEFGIRRRPITLTREYHALLNRFRCKLDCLFRTGVKENKLRSLDLSTDRDSGDIIYEPKSIDERSFKPIIKDSRIRLKNVQDSDKRFKLIASMIQGTTLVNKTDDIRYLMFHETVVSGLNTLSAIHSILSQYKYLVMSTDLKFFIDSIHGVINGAEGYSGYFDGLIPPSRNKDDILDILRNIQDVRLFGSADTDIDGPNPILMFNIARIPENVFIKDNYISSTAVFTAGNDKSSDIFKAQIKNAFNLHNIALDLIEGVFSTCDNFGDLVHVSIDEDRINVNFGRLKDHINKLFAQISYFIDAFRDGIDPAILEKYVDKKRVGSLYWLQEALIEKLIVGREAPARSEAVDLPFASFARDKPGYINLDELNRILNTTFRLLRTKYQNDGPNNVLHWGQLFARLIFYDNQLTSNSGLYGSLDSKMASKYVPYAKGAITQATPSIGIDFGNPYNRLLLLADGQKQTIYPDFSNRFHQLYLWEDGVWSHNNSLLFAFNEALAKYIALCYDTMSEKIYVNTIAHFVNGPAHNAIEDVEGMTYPDYVCCREGTSMRVASAAGGPVDKNAILAYNAFDVSGAGNILPPIGKGDDIIIAAFASINDNSNLPWFNTLKGATTIDGATLSSIAGVSLGELKANAQSIYSPGGFGVREPTRIRMSVLLALAGLQEKGKYPRFLIDMAQSAYDNPAIYATPEMAVSAGKNFYQFYYKNAGNYFVKDKAMTGKDIPTPYSTYNHNTNTQFGVRTDPHPSKVIFGTLALILRNLVSSKNADKQTIIYLLDNIAEVSGSTKEKLRANLPGFKVIFQEIINKGKFITKLMHMRGVNCYRSNYWNPEIWQFPGVYEGTDAGRGLQPQEDIYGNNRVFDNTKSQKIKNNFGATIDNITDCCHALIKCIDGVLRELADEPKYLEVYSGSIQDYRANNGENPLRPLSTLLYDIKDKDPNSRVNTLPFWCPGTSQFKFNFGTRGVLGRPQLKYDVAKENWWGELLDIYNSITPDRGSIDKVKGNEFANNIIDLAKYIHQFKLKGQLTPHVLDPEAFYNNPRGQDESHNVNYTVMHSGSLSRIPMTDLSSLGWNKPIRGNRTFVSINMKKAQVDNLKEGMNNVPIYQILNVNDLDSTMQLTTSNFKEETIGKIAELIAGGSPPVQNLAINNIVDLNIVPINIHALMREIPLANLYNYAYTFDRLVVDLFYGLNNNFANILIWKLCHANGKETVKDVSKYLNQNIGWKTNHSLRPSDDVNWDGSTLQFGLDLNAGIDESLIKSSKELFISLLIDPYRRVLTDKEYYYIVDMFRGDSNIPLGRPKFLSDQLFNKSLFGDIYGIDKANVNIYKLNKRNSPHGPEPWEMRMIPQELLYITPKKHFERDPEFGNNGVKQANLPNPVTKQILKRYGRCRFNTIFARNLVFLVNIYRVLRLKLRTDLVYDKGIILKGNKIARFDNTEFMQNQTMDHSADYEEMYGYGTTRKPRRVDPKGAVDLYDW